MKEIAKVGVAAGVLIAKEGKYLLIQEKHPRVYGLWNLPTGMVDEGETIEEAAVREAKEESGFDVKLVRKLQVLHQSISSPVLHAFEAAIAGGALNFPKDEILDAKWFSLEEVRAMKDKLRNVDYVLGSIEIVASGKE